MTASSSPIHEPHKFKTIRPIAFPSLEERKRNLSTARFNVFQLTPPHLTFDMVSYGTSAMTQEQLSGQLVGDEAYAGARNFETLNEVITSVLGQTYVCPTHNSLGAVKLLLRAFARPGQALASNARGRVDLHAPRVLGLDSAEILTLIVALAGAVVFAFLALVLNLPKWLAIIFTAIGGAAATVGGVLLIIGKITIEQVESNANPLQSILSESLLWSAVLIVLAIAGIVVQYQWTRNWEMRSREMWKVETPGMQ